ncbi:MAG: long-chain fatty acid--CoA ligase [Acidimicrobiia bacterium]
MGSSADIRATRPWHDQYDPDVSTSLTYLETTLDALLRRTAGTYPEHAAISFYGRTLGYKMLDQLVDRLANGLQELGLRPGDRVALFLPNCPQAVITYYAVWRSGGVVVPVNPLYTAPELRRQVEDSGASMIVVLSLLYPRVDVSMPGLRQVIVTNIKDYFPWWLRIAFTLSKERRSGHHLRRPLDEGTVTFSAVLAKGGADAARSRSRPDDPAAFLYTGGTTGIPKGAILTHRNLVVNAQQVGHWATGLDDGEEVLMAALPLTHTYAMTVCMNLSVLRGWTQVLVPDPRDLSFLLEQVERHRVTVLPGVPTLYSAINNHPGVREGRIDLSSIEVCISGAAGLPTEVQAEFQRITGGRLVEGYGLTEASPVTHGNPVGSGGRIGTIGVPLPDTDCKIVDVESETIKVRPGSPGILCISGPQVMKGYWNRPEETESTLRRDREGRLWLHTGDVAEMSDDGYFRIIDRQKDMILAAGGFNVYPREIEEELFAHPKVLQAAVIGIPVGGIDQRGKAFLVLRKGETATEEEMIEYLKGRLAPFKVPKAVEFRDELPLAFTGKVLRRVLAEEERGSHSPS